MTDIFEIFSASATGKDSYAYYSDESKTIKH